VNEDAGTATFTVTLTGHLQDTLSINYTTRDNTAITNGDYTGKTGILHFPANSANGDTLTINIQINEDLLVEQGEEFNVILSTEPGSLIGVTDSIGSGIILDNDSASVSITGITVNEADGEAIIILRVHGNVQDEFTLELALSDSTAVLGSDYTNISDSITFPAGMQDGDSILITIPVIDDSIVEEDEQFKIRIFNIEGNSPQLFIADSIAIVSILNDDYSPENSDFTINGSEDETLYFKTNNFTAAYFDQNNDALAAVMILSLPENGTLFLNNSQVSINQEISRVDLDKLTFVPKENWYGTSEFLYKVSDGYNWSETSAKVTILIQSVNDKPIAVDDSIETNEDSEVLLNVLQNDSDIESSNLSVTGINIGGVDYSVGNYIDIPLVGQFIIYANGEFQYQPAENYNDTIPDITYTISDNNGGSASANVFITIDSENDNPIAVNDILEISEDMVLNFNVLTNDSDPENDTLVVTGFTIDGINYTVGDSITIPSVGTVIISETGDLTYVPSNNYNGDIPEMEYTISDGNGGTASANIIITIDGENDNPIVFNEEYDICNNTELSANILDNGDYDLEPGKLTPNTTPLQDAQHGTFEILETGVFTYIPESDFDGTETIVISVCDYESACSNDTLTINVYRSFEINAGSNIISCDLQEISLSEATASSTDNLLWSTLGDGTFANNTQLNTSYAPGVNDIETGSVVLILSGEENTICGQSSDTLLVSINNAIEVFAGENMITCANQEVLIQGASAANYSNIRWETDGLGEIFYATSLSPTYVPSANDQGQIHLILIATGIGECSDQEVSDTMTIYYNQSFTVEIFGEDTVLYQNSTDLSAVVSPSDGNYTYQWSPENQVFSPNEAETVSEGLTENTLFSVVVTDTESGCSASDSIYVVVVTGDENDLDITNGISPNSDGNNDTWWIYNIENYPDNEVTIFNRWGDEIIKIRNYENTFNYWDGLNKSGKQVPDGTYYYLIKIYSNNKTYTGWVQVRANNQ
jgi:gliding motility-associated-like protein